MTKQAVAEEVLAQGRKVLLGVSLANTSMFSACLSKLQWPKLETEKQIQGGYYCY